MGLPDLKSKKKGKQKVSEASHVAEALNRLREQTCEAVKGLDSVASGQADDLSKDAMVEDWVKQFEQFADSQGMESILETMMQQLLSKEILHEPMKEIGERYPKWLEEHKTSLNKEEYERYADQYKLIRDLNEVYEKEPDNFTKIVDLMQKMQEFGQPPSDIVTELAPDIDLANLGQIFVQFHPTASADEGLPIKPKKAREHAFLITEAFRGDGGILYNLGMERFMPLYNGRAELAPRDVVARSLDDQLKKCNENYVLLDISHKNREKIISHFPSIASECLKCGLDITRQPIPVVPAAHYMCGGVRAGLQGETNVRGLYVAVEVACTGLHGATVNSSHEKLQI